MAVGRKNRKGNILERQVLVVQRLSSEVSGKAQKIYSSRAHVSSCGTMRRNSPLKGSKAACEKHFSSSLERKGLSCDILAGDQGPSCHSMKHIPDFKVIHLRFIKSSSSPTWPLDDEYASSSSRQQCVSEPVTPPRPMKLDRRCTSQRVLNLEVLSNHELSLAFLHCSVP